MQLGKFSSDRDSAIHFLCSSEWSNESFGDVQTFGMYVWRISNSWEEVKGEALDFSSVIEEWVEAEQLQDTKEFRRSLVGHFLVIEGSTGQVAVTEFKTEGELLEAYKNLEAAYLLQGEGEE